MSKQYPELSAELQRGLTWRSLRFFGAGAIIASVTIGSGETLSASRGGAVFGYTLLWALLASALMKGIQVYTAARHFTLTGQHPMTHWGKMPGPRNWVPAFFALITIACFPFWLSGIPLMIGHIVNWVLGVTGDDARLLFCARVWGTLAILVASGLTLTQSYTALERLQLAVVGLLLVSMLAACFASQPDWMAALAGLFPRLPEYEPWVVENYPQIAAKPVWVEVGWYLGAIGGGTYDYLGYIGCMREKRWGLIGRNEEDQPISSDAQNIVRGKRWLLPTQLDVGIGFGCVLIFTVCFTVLGATILHPQEKVPSGFNLFDLQAEFLTQFHPVMKYVYQVGIFVAFFGTIYGAYEIYIRSAQECLRPLSARIRQLPVANFRLAILLYCVVGGLAMMWTVADPISLVEPAAIVGGVFGCGLWCFAMIWADRRFVPRELQMPLMLTTLTFVSGVVLTALGAQSIWAYLTPAA